MKMLKTIIKESGLKQTVISKDLEINNSTLSLWVVGRAVPRKSMRLQIADYFGVNVDDVLWGDEKLSNNLVTVPDLKNTMPFAVGDKVVEIRPISKRDKIKIHGTVIGVYPRYICIKSVWGYNYCIQKADMLTGDVFVRREV